MLALRKLNVYYGKAHVIKDVDLHVEAKALVAVIGPNGAGKTTLLNALSGLKEHRGRIEFKGRPLPPRPAQIVQMGLIHCPEGRHLFSHLSVQDNLLLGAYRRRDSDIDGDARRVYEIFPILEERHRQLAHTLSGGEQQMLAIGRAWMSKPELLALDEPTLGLAPIARQAIAQAIRQIRAAGVTVLLAEQNAAFALDLADRLYLMETGRLCKEGTPGEFRADEHVRQTYLGR